MNQYKFDPEKVPAVSVAGVTKTYKKTLAVDNLSLSVPQGEYLAILGPNGAGKTTLVEMIEGLTKPDNGKIEVLGMNWRSHSSKIRRKLGISLQQTNFIDTATVAETLNTFASFYGQTSERVGGVLELVRLTHKADDRTVNLSGGQAQRLALGVALLNEPDIIILDEPTTGLDPVSRRELWNILYELKMQATTLLLTTHYMEEAEFLCDRIMIMDSGRILADGTLEELLEKLESDSQIQLHLKNGKSTGSFNETLQGRFSRVTNGKEDGLYTLYTDKLGQDLPWLISTIEESGLEIHDLNCRKMNLDDLFIQLAGRSLHEADA